MSLAAIKIVLVEPGGALNVGSIARVMKNMGLSNLVLVNPQCDRHSQEARQMAVHARDILDNGVIVNSLPEALIGCQRAIATTARSRSLPTRLQSPRDGLPWLLAPNITSALIFGPEARGLSNSELKYAQKFVGIPAHPNYPSLNLAQAVAVCAYELYQTSLLDNLDNIDNLNSCVSVQREKTSNYDPDSVDSVNNASLEVLEAYYQHLETVLLEIGFLYPHTAQARMDKIRRMYNRTNLTPEEIAMLRGMLRQIQWSNQNQARDC